MIGLIDSTLVGEAGAPPAQGAPGDRLLVLGVGNMLMGDEGVGIHILRALELLNLKISHPFRKSGSMCRSLLAGDTCAAPCSYRLQAGSYISVPSARL